MTKITKEGHPIASTHTVASGKSFIVSPETELVSILLTCYGKDEYHRPDPQTFERVSYLIAVVDKVFVAKAAIFARRKFGIRIITHFVAAELSTYAGGTPWGRPFYNAIVFRPDDMTSIAEFYFTKQPKFSNTIREGFKKAFNKFDGKTLLKYRSLNHKINLFDIINLTHPTETEMNKDVLTNLIKGHWRKVKTDSLQTRLKDIDQMSLPNGDNIALFTKAWQDILEKGHIGYFSLLKNFQNILQQAPSMVQRTLEILQDESRIKWCSILPFQYLYSFNMIKELLTVFKEENMFISHVLSGYSNAIDLSVGNVTRFSGETLVVLDVSKHMVKHKVEDTGTWFAATWIKSNNADLITFSDTATYQKVDSSRPLVEISTIKMMGSKTNFDCIFPAINRKYDRIIILSDIQGLPGKNIPWAGYYEWKKEYKANPFVYSFDLGNYAPMRILEDKVFALGGYSEKILSLMSLLESDQLTLINEVHEVTFY